MAAALGSGMVLLDALVVNIAVPQVGATLRASTTELQWILNAYTLTLAAFSLVGGALGDHMGHARVFRAGVIGFVVASVLCAVSPSASLLIGARALQGAMGALVASGSLSLLHSTIRASDQGRAVGIWSSSGALVGAASPNIGGWITDTLGWRHIFLLNVPLCLCVVLIVSFRFAARLPRGHSVNNGSMVALMWETVAWVAALGSTTYVLMEIAEGQHLQSSFVLSVSIAFLCCAALVLRGFRGGHVLVPHSMWRSKAFLGGCSVMFLLQFVLGAVLFFVTLDLQIVRQQSALSAAASLLPFSVSMLIVSPLSVRFAGRLRPLSTIAGGLTVAAGGTAVLAVLAHEKSLFIAIMLGVAVYGVGVAVAQAPLVNWLVSAGGFTHVGAAGGVVGLVSRAGTVVGVAVLPAAFALTGERYRDKIAVASEFPAGMWVCSGVLMLAASLAVVTQWGIDRRSGVR